MSCHVMSFYVYCVKLWVMLRRDRGWGEGEDRERMCKREREGKKGEWERWGERSEERGNRGSNKGRGTAEGKGQYRHGQEPDHYMNIHSIDLGGPYTHTHTCIHTFIRAYLHTLYVHTRINKHTHTHTHWDTLTYTETNTHAFIRTLTADVFKTHTHTHTHTHT